MYEIFHGQCRNQIEAQLWEMVHAKHDIDSIGHYQGSCLRQCSWIWSQVPWTTPHYLFTSLLKMQMSVRFWTTKLYNICYRTLKLTMPSFGDSNHLVSTTMTNWIHIFASGSQPHPFPKATLFYGWVCTSHISWVLAVPCPYSPKTYPADVGCKEHDVCN
ncbi:hypothetical protein AAG906_037900 [Vitis piasezkii]